MRCCVRVLLIVHLIGVAVCSFALFMLLLLRLTSAVPLPSLQQITTTTAMATVLTTVSSSRD